MPISISVHSYTSVQRPNWNQRPLMELYLFYFILGVGCGVFVLRSS